MMNTPSPHPFCDSKTNLESSSDDLGLWQLAGGSIVDGVEVKKDGVLPFGECARYINYGLGGCLAF